AAGLAITLVISITIGLIFPVSLESAELLSRTRVGLALVILALAAGVAGVFSVTTALSGALVGVMVAVALLPPAVALGLYLGDFQLANAYAGALILMVNIVCISLAAQLVFLFRGIKPRTYYMRKEAEQSARHSIFFWALLLLALTGLIMVRKWL